MYLSREREKGEREGGRKEGRKSPCKKPEVVNTTRRKLFAPITVIWWQALFMPLHFF
jgi:hypothetical protein